MEGLPVLVRYRVINRVTGQVLTEDMPHLHQSKWTITGFQPGSPGSTMIGSFEIPLHPPGSEKYRVVKKIVDASADYFLRIEGYLSHYGTVIGGAPAFAGLIRNIEKSYGDSGTYMLTGVTDVGYANYSKPFPGSYLYLKYGSGLSTASSYRQARHYFGTNEPGGIDNFNPFVAANYVSTNMPTLTAGAWTAGTDDGRPVVQCSSGGGAVLIKQQGAAAGDSLHRQYVEASGRMKPSSHITNAGVAFVGITKAAGNVTNSLCCLLVAGFNTATQVWDMSVRIRQVSAGSLSDLVTATFPLTGVSDPESMIAFSMALSWTGNDSPFGAQVVVNGRTIFSTVTVTAIEPGTGVCYPFIGFGTPASGSATVYYANLVQAILYSDDGHPGIAMFKPGVIGTPQYSLPLSSTPAANHLDQWARSATRESWYLRYTPVAYVPGVRTVGVVDMNTGPGSDLSQQVIFDRKKGNLISLSISGNADQFMSGTQTAGPPSADGGGLAIWRDISSVGRYGIIDDASLSLVSPNFNELWHASQAIMANKLALGTAGAKKAVVLRDPTTAGKWREQDFVSINDAEMDVNYLRTRIVGYTFVEGDPLQTIFLDQFSIDDPTLLLNRWKVALFGMAAQFGSR